jgi:nitrogen fixation NifU-like protein
MRLAMPTEDDLFDDIEGLIVAEARKSYSEKVIDHFMNPRNVGAMDEADCSTYMSGICGDTIGIFVRLSQDRIERVSFVTNGCGATIACGSALTSLAQGLSIDEARKLTGNDLIRYLDGLPRENTHCADLAVNTLRGALEKARMCK